MGWKDSTKIKQFIKCFLNINKYDYHMVHIYVQVYIYIYIRIICKNMLYDKSMLNSVTMCVNTMLSLFT